MACTLIMQPKYFTFTSRKVYIVRPMIACIRFKVFLPYSSLKYVYFVCLSVNAAKHRVRNKCGFSLNVDIRTRNFDTHTRTWPLILRLKALINLPALSLPTHAM